MVDQPIPITLHLEELRKRLMIAAGAWILAFGARVFGKEKETRTSSPTASLLALNTKSPLPPENRI